MDSNKEHNTAGKKDSYMEIPSLALFPHKMEAQLRFNDIDILGHLNNTVYFSLYDMGKARFLEASGLRRKGDSRPDTVIADIHCTYMKPIHFDDSIFVATRCSHIGEKSYVLEQMLVDDKGEVYSICRTVMVHLDAETGLPAPLTDEHIALIKRYDAEHTQKK